MKKILYSLIAAISFAGCSDLLDTEPLDKYTESVVWNDETLAQYFIYDSYVTTFTEFLATPGITQTTQIGSGMEAFSDNMLVISWTTTNYQQNEGSADYDYGWDGKVYSVFSCIRQANVIIENAEASSLASKESMVAQGKFLRALIYFKQARAFGGYIIIDRVLDMSDELNIPRSSIDETYDFIINDLQEAAADLPSNEVNTHITKGAAYALLAEVALQAAAYSENGGKDKYLQISLDASEALMALNQYSLDDSYYNIFHNFGSVESNNEIILAYSPVTSTGYGTSKGFQYRFVTTVKQSDLHADVAAKYPLNTNLNGMGGHFSVSQDMIDEYLVVDEDGVAKKWNETSYYLNCDKNTVVAADVLYKNRDSRFEASVVRDGTMFYDNTMYFRKGGNAHPESGISTSTYLLRCLTPYFMRKSINDTDTSTNGFNVPMDYAYVLLRLGRSYLNYAEALLRTGKTSDAIGWINKTRVTHGDLPELSTSLSAAEAWEAYEAERRVDVFFEGEDRYWSLLRWHKHDGESVIAELNKDLTTYTEIGEDGIGFTENVAIRADYFSTASRNVMVWNERRYLFPVPQTKIDESDGVIKQNSGW